MSRLSRLQNLLEHLNNYDNCLGIMNEAWVLSQEHPEGWFFSRLHATIRSLVDAPDMFYGVSEDCPSPVLDNIALVAIHGIAAIELEDNEQLMKAADELKRSSGRFRTERLD